jgi:hypothetical protein
MTPDATEFEAGDSITVTISVSAVSQAKALQFKLIMPTDVFENVQVSDPWESELATALDADSSQHPDFSCEVSSTGKVIYAATWYNAYDITAQTLLTITADVKADATLGSAALSWDGACGYSDSSNSFVTFTKTDGSVSIYSFTASPIAITSIDAPVKYAAPDTDVDAGTGYTVDSIAWADAVGNAVGSSDTYATDTVYKATVTLAADTYYKFNDDQTVTVSYTEDEETQYATVSVTSVSDTSLTFTATFDATDSQSVTSVAVTPTDGTVAVPTAASGTASTLQMTADCEDNGQTIYPDVTWSVPSTYAGVSIGASTGLLSVDCTAASNTFDGENKLTVSVTAAAGGESDTQTVKITRLASVVTSVEVTRGSSAALTADNLAIPPSGSDAYAYEYAAVAYDQYGIEMSDTFTWTLTTEDTYVTLSGSTVSVANGATKGTTYTLKAASDTDSSVNKEVGITLQDLTLDWTTAGITAEDTITYGTQNSEAFSAWPTGSQGTAYVGSTPYTGTFSVDDSSYLETGSSGTITVTFTVGADQGDYSGVTITKDYTINTISPKAITVAAAAASRYYNAADPDLTYTYDTADLVGNEVSASDADIRTALAVTLKTTASSDSDAGSSYQVVIDTCASTNYTVTVTPATFTINPDPVTIDAGQIETSLTAIYANNGNNQASAYLLDYIYPDTVNVTGGNGGGTSTAHIAWAYASGSTFDIKGGAYTFTGTVVLTDTTNFTYTGGAVSTSITVTPVTGSISAVDGSAATALTSSVTVAQATAAAATSYTDLKLPGSITITYANGGSDGANVSSDGTATYSSLAWDTALDTLKAKTAGSSTTVAVSSSADSGNIPLWATISSGLSVTVNITQYYPVTVTVSAPTGGTMTYGDTLTQPQATVTAIDDGAPASPSSEDFTYTYKNTVTNATTTTIPTEAGSYTVTAYYEDGTYEGTSEAVSFTIAPLAVTVTPDGSQSKVYGAADPTLTYTVSPDITGLAALSGALSYESAGQYASLGSPSITLGTLTTANNPNYTISLGGAVTFEITAATPSISLAAKTQEYTGSAVSIADATVSGVSGGTTPGGAVTYTYYSDAECTSPLTGAPTDVGEYYVKASIAADGNYGTATSASVKLTITVKALAASMIADVDAQTYTGSAITPTPAVTNGSLTLASGTDFTFGYSSNTNVGTATLTITAVADGNYSGTASKTFTISKKALESTMIADISALTYTGSAQTPTPEVTYNTMTLVSGTDFTFGYSSNTNAGAATLTITAKTGSNYSGTASKTFTINAYSITGKITFSAIADATFTGSAIKPTPTVTVDLNGTATTLKAGTDFTFSYSDNINASTATAAVTVTGTGNYADTASTTFISVAKAMEASMVSGVSASYTYTGSAITPEPTLIFNSKEMAVGTDYDIAYSDNTSAGTATITITGIGNYTSSIDVTFTIEKAALGGTVRITSTGTIAVGAELYANTDAVTPASAALYFQWYSGGVAIAGAEATDSNYTVAEGDTSLYVVITPQDTANCSGSLQSAAVEVGKTDISDGRTLSISGSAELDGTLSVTFSSGTLTYGTDYTLQWLRDDTAVATTETYTITESDLGHTIKAVASGAGNYTGSLLATLAVSATVPDTPVITAVTPGSGSLKISWTSPFDGGSDITKYTLTVGSETYILSASTTSYTATGLTNGTAYPITLSATNGVGTSAEGTSTGTPKAPAGSAVSSGGGSEGSTFDITIGGGSVEATYKTSGSKITLDMDAAEVASNLSGQSSIEFDLSGVSGSDTVVLPNDVLAAIAEANAGNGQETGITLNLPGFTMSIDSAALASVVAQANGADVEFGVSEAELNAAQQAIAGSHPVYDVSVTCGGAAVSNLGGGSVAVSVPYALRDGETASDIVVYYLDDDGYLRQVEDFIYDEATGLMTFNLPHLSLYMIASGTTLPFADVAADSWFEDAVRFVYENGLFNGTSETAFSPDVTMSRAMFVTVLGRLAQAEVDQNEATEFTDVVVDGWSAGYISWATGEGIISGYGDGLFGQYDSVTREQMAVILYNYAKWAGFDVSNTDTEGLYAFTDGMATASWAVDAMAWAVNSGILNGSGNAVTPGAPATRAQVAQIITNFFDSVMG